MKTKGCRSCEHFSPNAGVEGNWACYAIGGPKDSSVGEWIDAQTGSINGYVDGKINRKIPKDSSTCPCFRPKK